MSKILPQFRRLEQTRLRLGKYRTAILQAISLTRRTNKIQRPCFSVSYYDENHVQIGDHVMECLGPRMHISSTGKIEDFTLVKDYPQDPATGYYMLIGLIGSNRTEDIHDLNRIDLNRQLHRS